MQGGLLVQTCIDRGRMGTWAVPQGIAYVLTFFYITSHIKTDAPFSDPKC